MYYMGLGRNVIIKQELEVAEILTAFETGNRYSILDERGSKILYAYEDESNFIGKQIFGQHRGVKLHLLDTNGNELLSIDRPFYFLKSKAIVYSNDGQIYGYIHQKKWLGTKQFDFLSLEGQLLFSCISKLPHKWTFKVFMGEQEVAQVLKKWSGFGKEAFTDTDTFSIDFGNINDDYTQYAILTTAFIIDIRKLLKHQIIV